MHLLLSLRAWLEEYERYEGTLFRLEENPFFALKAEYYDEKIKTKVKLWKYCLGEQKVSVLNEKGEHFIEQTLYGVDELLLFWIFVNIVDNKFITFQKGMLRFNWEKDPFHSGRLKNMK